MRLFDIWMLDFYMPSWILPEVRAAFRLVGKSLRRSMKPWTVDDSAFKRPFVSLALAHEKPEIFESRGVIYHFYQTKEAIDQDIEQQYHAVASEWKATPMLMQWLMRQAYWPVAVGTLGGLLAARGIGVPLVCHA